MEFGRWLQRSTGSVISVVLFTAWGSSAAVAGVNPLKVLSSFRRGTVQAMVVHPGGTYDMRTAESDGRGPGRRAVITVPEQTGINATVTMTSPARAPALVPGLDVSVDANKPIRASHVHPLLPALGVQQVHVTTSPTDPPGALAVQPAFARRRSVPLLQVPWTFTITEEQIKAAVRGMTPPQPATGAPVAAPQPQFSGLSAMSATVEAALDPTTHRFRVATARHAPYLVASVPSGTCATATCQLTTQPHTGDKLMRATMTLSKPVAVGADFRRLPWYLAPVKKLLRKGDVLLTGADVEIRVHGTSSRMFVRPHIQGFKLPLPLIPLPDAPMPTSISRDLLRKVMPAEASGHGTFTLENGLAVAIQEMIGAPRPDAQGNFEVHNLNATVKGSIETPDGKLPFKARLKDLAGQIKSEWFANQTQQGSSARQSTIHDRHARRGFLP